MYRCISAERRLNWVQNTYLSHESPKVLGNRLSATCLRSIQNMNKRLAHLKRRRRIHQCSSTPALFRQLFCGISTSREACAGARKGKNTPSGLRETPLVSELIQLIGTKTVKNATTVCLTSPGRQKKLAPATRWIVVRSVIIRTSSGRKPRGGRDRRALGH